MLACPVRQGLGTPHDSVNDVSLVGRQLLETRLGLLVEELQMGSFCRLGVCHVRGFQLPPESLDLLTPPYHLPRLVNPAALRDRLREPGRIVSTHVGLVLKHLSERLAGGRFDIVLVGSMPELLPHRRTSGPAHLVAELPEELIGERMGAPSGYQTFLFLVIRDSHAPLCRPSSEKYNPRPRDSCSWTDRQGASVRTGVGSAPTASGPPLWSYDAHDTGTPLHEFEAGRDDREDASDEPGESGNVTTTRRRVRPPRRCTTSPTMISR